MSRGGFIGERLRRSFGMYRELAGTMDESALLARLPGLPSNTIGAQLWCVVGARESYPGTTLQRIVRRPASSG